jgi:hypothetical protein
VIAGLAWPFDSQLHHIKRAEDTDGLTVFVHHDVMDMAIHHVGCDLGEFRFRRALHNVAIHEVVYPEYRLRLVRNSSSYCCSIQWPPRVPATASGRCG